MLVLGSVARGGFSTDIPQSVILVLLQETEKNARVTRWCLVLKLCRITVQKSEGRNVTKRNKIGVTGSEGWIFR